MFRVVVALFLLLPPVRGTVFSVDASGNFNDSTSVVKSLPLSGFQNTVFGLAEPSDIDVVLNLTYRLEQQEEEDGECIVKVALCESDGLFVRSPSFELRHPLLGVTTVLNDLATAACNGKCRDRKLQSGRNIFSLQGAQRGIHTILAVKCTRCGPIDAVDLQGNVELTNPDTVFPQLGIEEAAFPIVALISTAVLSFSCLLLICGAVYGVARRLPTRTVFVVVVVACVLKGLGAGLTFTYFWHVAQTGARSGWYVYTRWTLGAVADIAFIFAVMMLGAGYCVLPSCWFVENRSPMFVVYLGVTLQVLIIIAVKLLFPFRYIGILAYTVAGGVIALLSTTASMRLRAFFGRYIILLQHAHIRPRSTPIFRAMRFYTLNSIVVPIVYAFKIVNLGIWDYGIRRPDLVWAGIEVSDAVLLLWFTIAVLPRRRSTIYVDLTNLSNDRLQRAETWRAAQAEGRSQRRSSTADGAPSAQHGSDEQEEVVEQAENGTVRPGEEGAQPPWTDWESGMALPRPDASTWGGYVQVSRILRRERKLVPVLPSNVVLGDPADEEGRLRLTVGIPTAGPRLVPKVFDEKGIEIGSQAQLRQEEKEEEDRDDIDRRVRMGRRRRRRDEGGGIEESLEPAPNREFSVLAPSVASSGASADGVLWRAQEEK